MAATMDSHNHLCTYRQALSLIAYYGHSSILASYISKKKFAPGIYGQAWCACARYIKSFCHVTSYRSSPPHLLPRSSFSNLCVLFRLVITFPNILRPVLCFPSSRANSWLKSDALRPLTYIKRPT